MITPINDLQKNLVIQRTQHFIDQASEIFQRDFNSVIVNFDLKGRAAGMYRRQRNQHVIRYNPYLFAKYFEDNMASTIPHEVAHYIADMMFTHVRPHGKEWREVMQTFGVDAKRTCDYDLEGIPVRVHQRHDYQCTCMTHALTSRRHNKIQKRAARYFCKNCHEEITLQVVNG